MGKKKLLTSYGRWRLQVEVLGTIDLVIRMSETTKTPKRKSGLEYRASFLRWEIARRAPLAHFRMSLLTGKRYLYGRSELTIVLSIKTASASVGQLALSLMDFKNWKWSRNLRPR